MGWGFSGIKDVKEKCSSGKFSFFPLIKNCHKSQSQSCNRWKQNPLDVNKKKIPLKVGTSCVHHPLLSVPKPQAAAPDLACGLGAAVRLRLCGNWVAPAITSIFHRLIDFLWTTELSAALGPSDGSNNSLSLTLTKTPGISCCWRNYHSLLLAELQVQTHPLR